MCDSVYYLHYMHDVCMCVLDMVVVPGYWKKCWEKKINTNYNVVVKLCEILTDSECRQWTPNKIDNFIWAENRKITQKQKKEKKNIQRQRHTSGILNDKQKEFHVEICEMLRAAYSIKAWCAGLHYKNIILKP